MDNFVIEQASTVLADMVEQATGVKPIADNTVGGFISVATTALKNGYDPILNAMNQMWSKTIFSVRPYNARFKGLRMDAARWGNATRKISIADTPIGDDERFSYPVGYSQSGVPPTGNGKSVDMYKLAKPDVQQTNFYGQGVYQDVYTIFRDNLDVAFSAPDEFMRFNSMVAQNRSDKLEQHRETVSRSLVANAIASILDEQQNGRVVHLLSEYNTATGMNLTAQTVYQPDNFAPFMRWVYARIATIAEFMRDRSIMYQTVINGKNIYRHTPADKLKAYLYAPAVNQINAMTNSITFHDNLLEFADFEPVSYWQSIETPDSIAITPVYTDTTGAQKTGAPTEQAGVFGILFDEDFIGYSEVNHWSEITPFNAAGGYWNSYDHINFRTLFDMTEKAVVLLLD